jgi:hypothetical protein
MIFLHFKTKIVQFSTETWIIILNLTDGAFDLLNLLRSRNSLPSFWGDKHRKTLATSLFNREWFPILERFFKKSEEEQQTKEELWIDFAFYVLDFMRDKKYPPQFKYSSRTWTITQKKFDHWWINKCLQEKTVQFSRELLLFLTSRLGNTICCLRRSS